VQCAHSKSSGDHVAHHVGLRQGRQVVGHVVGPRHTRHLRVAVGRRQVPALRVFLIDGLAISSRIVWNARRVHWRTLQQVLVEARLPLFRAGQSLVQNAVADAELIVTQMVCRDADHELDNLAWAVIALDGRRLQVGLVADPDRGRRALHGVPAQAVGAGGVLRGPHVLAPLFDGGRPSGLQAMRADLLAPGVGHQVPRGGLRQVGVACGGRQQAAQHRRREGQAQSHRRPKSGSRPNGEASAGEVGPGYHAPA